MLNVNHTTIHTTQNTKCAVVLCQMHTLVGHASPITQREHDHPHPRIHPAMSQLHHGWLLSNCSEDTVNVTSHHSKCYTSAADKQF